ncbi:cytochrome c oxidase assembly factor 1 -like protein [Brachionus plicatilis]|uniref:Cytochrome c oxidase assembly factor 1-like protein n=1 Tax=Brachionus plicatilis TaxID=10195 RepID=A0A3M7SYH0_BRAPC|nr:cytochrome c oxidase assembly factor 1 -like protein [Brachionus plicatilis]
MQKLLKVYVASGVLFGGGYYLYKMNYSSSKISKQNYYTDAIDLLNGYKPAVDTLGGRIKVEKFDESDSFNDIQEKEAKIKILVKGDKKMAEFFVYASRQESDPNWSIDTLEIKYRGSANKFKIFDRSIINNSTNSIIPTHTSSNSAASSKS